MIKHWQSMQEYQCSLHNFKIQLDSSERTRLHSELWEPWQKLRLLDTDLAMDFLLPFYSPTGRPAKNQPQIIRSFVLFFLFLSKGLTPPSLTLWVQRLASDRLLAALIGCTSDSLPPLGSYFDFMDRLWAVPDPAFTHAANSFPKHGTAKNPQSLKAKDRRHRNQSLRLQKNSHPASWTAEISLFILNAASSSSFTGLPSFPPSGAA